ncbi:hypothetical protein [Mycobacterium sp.]|uniref:hypothetical protein n=1 Tax=Mycobacterium sp. TaxID=1785 RepID=UPI003BAF9866
MSTNATPSDLTRDRAAEDNRRMADEVPTREIPESVKARGIVDRATGIERARASRQWLHDAAAAALSRTDQLHDSHFLIMGLATRAAGLHDGTVHALETDNPFAAYTTLRSYAENAAALLYATDHPDQLDRILGFGDTYPIKVGVITNYADQGSTRFGAFRGVYADLSEFAHPMSRSIFASAKRNGDNGIRWSLEPAFKYDVDFMVTCALVVEMAEANSHLLREYADSQGW